MALTLIGSLLAGCASDVPGPADSETAKTPDEEISPVAWADEMMVVDLDGDWPAIYIDDLSSREAMLSRMDFYFDTLLKGTEVTDVTLNCFEQSSYVPSETMDWCHEKMAKYVAENGPMKGFESISASWTALYQALTDNQVDWYQEALDRCKERGVRTWAYLRMDDRHNLVGATSPFRDSFFDEAKEKVYLIGRSDLYGASVANQYDYAHPEVRSWMLRYIEEILSRYDTFGLELDFMRRIECFDYVNNPDCTSIMTQFIRDVRALMDEAEKIRGHELKLMIRLGPDVADCLTYGFDAAAWAKEGLVDVLVPSGHDDVADSEIDVAAWREAVGDDVAIVPGFDSNMCGYPHLMTAKYLKGYAAGYYVNGCDGIYLENYYQIGSEGPSVWGLSPDDMTKGIRSYVRIGRALYPVGTEPIITYPVELRNVSENGIDFVICTGKIGDGDRVTVTIGYDGGTGDLVPDLTVNGTAAANGVRTSLPDDGITGRYLKLRGKGEFSIFTASKLATYDCTGIITEDNVTLHFDQSAFRIYYIEITVDAAD